MTYVFPAVISQKCLLSKNVKCRVFLRFGGQELKVCVFLSVIYTWHEELQEVMVVNRYFTVEVSWQIAC